MRAMCHRGPRRGRLFTGMTVGYSLRPHRPDNGARSPSYRRALAEYADFVADNWRRSDAGLWEVRGRPAYHVHSRVRAWIALDRLARTVAVLGMSRRRLARWERERERLADEVRRRGVDARRSSYVRAYGSDELDSVLLLLPLTGFDEAGGERLLRSCFRPRRLVSVGR
jgi:GH15 family glucan-1,4-alpha-glucosidase